MPDTKISALTAAASFLLADEIPVNEAGATKKVTGTGVITMQAGAVQAGITYYAHILVEDIGV